MSYSTDVRRLVERHVAGGGSKSEAARIYGVSRATVYLWLGYGTKHLKGTKPGPKRNRKVDASALLASIKARPDIRIADLGAQFGVHESTISYALKRAGVTRKKNVPIFSRIVTQSE
jgi:putative transposase